jgi:hypothetical protein
LGWKLICLRQFLLRDDSAADWSTLEATKNMRIITSSEGAPLGTPHGLLQHQGMTFSVAAPGTTIFTEAVMAATLRVPANQQPLVDGQLSKYDKPSNP